MSNINNSKEIYKRLPGVKPSESPLRAIRGLYVSGTKKDPYYIDQGIHITCISTTKSLVIPFYLKTSELTPDNIVSVSNIESDDYNITEYTRTSSELTPDNIVSVSNIESDDYNITLYGREYNNLVSDNIVSVSNIESDDCAITMYDNKLYDTKECVIRLSSISATPANIT